MGSRDKDQKARHHQPHISSLVIRPTVSDGPDGGGGGGRGGGGSDYEPGEVRRDLHPYSRAERYHDDPGYRIRAGSASPVRRRDADQRYGSDLNHSSGPPRSRGFGGGRGPGRYRESSPPYSRGKFGARPFDRGLEGPGFGHGQVRGDSLSRNNPNVRPREGDWICADPVCRNLNFARREYCNNCKRHRYAPRGSPRRGFAVPPPPPHGAPRRVPGPPLDLSPGRTINGYGSPPRVWDTDGRRDYEPGLPPPRHEGRFSDHIGRERLDYLEDDYRGRSRLDRPVPVVDWGQRDRGRDSFFNERKGYERRMPSPPLLPPTLPPHRGRWGRELRERSRSPIRGGFPPKDYHQDMYVDRVRDDRRGLGRDRLGDTY